MKKIYIIIIALTIIGLISFIYINNYINKDSLKFKKEYEKLNGKKTENGKIYRTINITEDNPIKYANEDKIVEMIKNNDTFVVYFGFAKCPWCRSVIPELIEAAKDQNINTIYYVDIYKIRDNIMIDENNKLSVKQNGTKGYKKLLKLLNNVLEDYRITDLNDNEINTGEKRIYAPNVISIVNGHAKKIETGISDKLTDPYMKLTEEIKNDTYNKFKCSLKCITENNTCTKKNVC